MTEPDKLTPAAKQPLPATAEAVADGIIADCGGDARAAVIELVAVVRHLANENAALIEGGSPGFARRPPPRVKKGR